MATGVEPTMTSITRWQDAGSFSGKFVVFRTNSPLLGSGNPNEIFIGRMSSNAQTHFFSTSPSYCKEMGYKIFQIIGSATIERTDRMISDYVLKNFFLEMAVASTEEIKAALKTVALDQEKLEGSPKEVTIDSLLRQL